MRKIKISKDALITLYVRNGMTTCEIGELLVVSGATICKRLREHGIPTRSRRIEIKQDIVSMHLKDNFSVLEIAGKLGVSRGVVVQRLHEAGVQQRTGSESQKIRMEKMSPKERKRNASAAHEARRGQVDSDEDVVRRIRPMEGRALSGLETLVKGFLDESGVTGFELNQIVGRYLIDVCNRSRKLAIEVDGGNWHTSPVKAEKDARKERFLLDNGWTILRIRDPNPGKLNALLNQIRSLPVPACSAK